MAQPPIAKRVPTIRERHGDVVTDDYVYAFDDTTWGWIHLVLGIVVLLAGIGLFQGATWARVVARLLPIRKT